MKHAYIIYRSALLLIMAATASCKKKLDHEFDNRANQQPVANSSVRIVNLAGASELTIDDQKLTSYIQPDNEGGYGPTRTSGTLYFPESGRLGTIFTIPLSFVKEQGIIPGIQLSNLATKSALPISRLFQATDNYNDSHDYYYVRFSPNHNNYVDSMFVISRSVSPSSNPANCRIRVINLSSTPDPYHTGPVSLAYADGTPVTGLTNVATGTASSYIEMPYGTYRFKLLDQDGKEIPGKTLELSPIVNDVTGTLMNIGEGDPGSAGFSDSWITQAPIKTYQPGGVYTIAVSRVGGYSNPIPGSNGQSVGVFVNCWQIIADISEPVNTTWARMQTVNTLAQPVQLKVDQQPANETIAYTQQTGYQSYVTGKHTITLTDANGSVLAEENIQLEPGDNITAWACQGKEGKPAIRFVANNLSAKYTGTVNGNDGSYSTVLDIYPNWVRFLNFCTEQPEVTFTADNGQPLGTPANHIQHATPLITDPYIRIRPNSSQKIMAYASTPALLPGNWLNEIAPLNSKAFIANPAMYPVSQTPNREPGIYTVALVGSTKAGVPAAEKAKMIIIRHNR